MPKCSRTCNNRHCLRAAKTLSQQTPLWYLAPRLGVGRRLGWLWVLSACYRFSSSVFRFLSRLPPSSPGVPWGSHHEAPAPDHWQGGSVTLSGQLQSVIPQHGASFGDRCRTPRLGSWSGKEAEQGRLVTSLDLPYPWCLRSPAALLRHPTALAFFVSATLRRTSVTCNQWSPDLSSILFEKLK